MNIFTIPYGSNSFYVRPDTSLNRESSEYYCPSNIKELVVSKFIYAKALKAGKCIAPKFAERYYNKIGSGIQLIAPELIDSNSPETWWLAHSLDSSTFTVEQETDATEYTSSEIEQINNAFARVSKHISVRTGDYIAIEISREKITSPCPSVCLEGKEIKIIW